MNIRTADWMIGQIDAIRRLTAAIADTVNVHCPAASEELKTIEWACKRAAHVISEQVKGAQEQ